MGSEMVRKDIDSGVMYLTAGCIEPMANSLHTKHGHRHVPSASHAILASILSLEAVRCRDVPTTNQAL